MSFHVVKGLSEQVLLSNQHCQQLGLVTIRNDNEKLFVAPQSEHPGSFRLPVNNLSLSWPEPENLTKTKHACTIQKDSDLDELNGVASEIESRSRHIKDIPDTIKNIVLEHPKVFKTDLDPTDHIDLVKIPGYSKYEEGIKIEVQPDAKPVANHSMRQVPLHYAGRINEMYQKLVDQEVVRKVLPNEVCEWVSPS